jgi:hypothetical protein
MSASVGKGIVHISEEFLLEVFKFPEGTELVQAILPKYDHSISLILYHDNIPELPVGAALPEIKPWWKRVETSEFGGWDYANDTIDEENENVQ